MSVPITPLGLCRELAQVAQGDRGTERKCMLFYDTTTKRYLKFVRVRSEARVTVLELVDERDYMIDVGSVASTDPAPEIPAPTTAQPEQSSGNRKKRKNEKL